MAGIALLMTSSMLGAFRDNDVTRREQPHAIDQTDQMLLVVAQHDIVVRIGTQ